MGLCSDNRFDGIYLIDISSYVNVENGTYEKASVKGKVFLI